jgi:hypothetical protein
MLLEVQGLKVLPLDIMAEMEFLAVEALVVMLVAEPVEVV